ncbi:type II toxin-antitoxin system PemK/MazF family toxin [Methyloraptor flagellatus]|uniref:Type II toxin-antitoxin system PemK/MazF family toxin n=1 Tax=Methyloraptor flagellatus TaxID=3162530 RepID=A0AAU7XAE6_9HYPH
MPTFERGTVVRVPFPYTDRVTRRRRPALVVSDGPVGDGHLLWVVMITSAENRPWPGDVALGERSAAAGLPAPSIVRPTKIATIEVQDADPIGQIDATSLDAVLATIRTTMAL